MTVAQLPTGATPIGFRQRTVLDDSPRAAREVRLAIARAKAGDPEGVRVLYARYSDNVYGYVRSIVRDDYEAEDITQQVFAKLMTMIGRFEDRGTPFFAWLLRISRNAAIDHMRHLRAVPAENVRALARCNDPDGEDRGRCLHDALAMLPEEQRNVVILRHVVGLSPSEIATHMQRTESSVHGLHHRGRRALRRELCRMGAAPATPLTAA